MIRIITKVEGYAENIHVFKDVAGDGSITWGARIGDVAEPDVLVTGLASFVQMVATVMQISPVTGIDLDKALERLRYAKAWRSFQIALPYAVRLGETHEVELRVTHFDEVRAPSGKTIVPEMFMAQLGAGRGYFHPRLSVGWSTRGNGAGRRTTHRMHSSVWQRTKRRAIRSQRELEAWVNTMAA